MTPPLLPCTRQINPKLSVPTLKVIFRSHISGDEINEPVAKRIRMDDMSVREIVKRH